MSATPRFMARKDRHGVVPELSERRLEFHFKVSTPNSPHYRVRAYLAEQFYSTIINRVSLANLLIALWLFYR